MSDVVKCERDGALATITLNRPDCGNLISNAMGAEIAGLLEANRDATLIALRGAGKDFCLGRDSASLRASGSPKDAVDARNTNTEPALAFYASVRRVPAPVLGIVQGGALGLGCALAGLCDVTIAADDARFQLPEMEHGIPPCLAMSALLDRLSPKAIAWLVYSTEILDAQWALSQSLVSTVVPAAKLEEAAQAFIRKTLARKPEAVPAVKEYLRSAPRMDHQAAADFGSNLLANVMVSGKKY